MTIEQFDKYHRARPFRPFSVHLADGRSFRVRHPEFAARTPGGRTLLIADSDEAVEAIDLLLVTSAGHANGTDRPKGKRRARRPRT